jgi:hypothetical protein
MSLPYHSALKEEVQVEGELNYYEHNGSVVLCHNISQGIHHAFQAADAIYSEPPWKDGYAKFLTRAGCTVEDAWESFKDYLSAINSIIKELNVPTYLIIGKHMVSRLKPERTHEIKLHGYDCLLGVWNTGTDLSGMKTNEDVLKYVATNHSCVFDFSCGYGNTAVAMFEQGKRFICSDINKKCVYYVAKYVMGKK